LEKRNYRIQDLLGKGIWHFLRADKNISLLIAALQQEQTFQRVIIIEEKALIYYSLFKLFVSSRETKLSTAFEHLKIARSSNCRKNLNRCYGRI